MKPVRLGDRGPAVEDIQRRLRALGYDLGPTGIDGVFFGRTSEALAAFKADRKLDSQSVVDDATWAALVDATFTLGDRMLYLKAPHFHGHDVQALQEALNALGFTCGNTDGIFGAYTERAVREFQRNTGLFPDGIAGADTTRSVLALKHVWEGKTHLPHSAAHGSAVRRCEGLGKNIVVVRGLDALGHEVALRMANLAAATHPESKLVALESAAALPEPTRLLVGVCGLGAAKDLAGRPVVRANGSAGLESRLLAAVESARTVCPEVVLELDGVPLLSEHEQQRAAVRLLDALCAVFD
jgi:peptidoglycan hydrolase-like protein with peptidoglycan-binding domain